MLAIAQPAGAVASAELYRPAAHTFGKFEARIQFGSGDGVVSSFFLWKDGSELSTAYWNELDFEKLGAACSLQTNSIYGLPETNHEGHDYGIGGLCEGYHTYVYEWTPDYIAWFVDGTEIRRETGEMATAYAENAAEGMQFRFNIWPGNANFGGNFSESILPVYQYVSWAQYSEYTPGVGDDGSDFTLAWREEFDSAPTGWQMGSWGSPLNNSTHSPQNVAFVDGIAVLALTADDATGYSGTPPVDDGTTVVVPPTDEVDGETPPARPKKASSDGCNFSLTPSQSGSASSFVLLACAALGWLTRRRLRTIGA
jgi:hypothetical protein